MPVLTLRRAGLTAAATLAGLGVLSAAPASAESAELDYTCSAVSLTAPIDLEELPDDLRGALEKAQEGDLSGVQGLSGVEGLADLPLDVEADLQVTAVFDSAIKDGATAAVGSTVKLSPLSTTITLPAETVALLSDVDLDTALAGAVLYAGIDETGADREAFFEFDEVAVENGRIQLVGTGEAQSFRLREAGEHTYVGGDLDVFIGDPEGMFTALECTLDEDQDSTIDVITAKAAAPAPTTPTTPPAPAPVRPDIVQTDAAQPTSPAWLPLAATGLGSVLVLGAASRLTRRSAHRD